LTPIALSIYIGCQCPILGPFVWHGLFDMAIILGVATTIAIFGSYKIAELQQQAFAARKLGQYLLHKKLGAGGMGEVYLGEHTMLRRACAIKLIRPEQAGDPTTLSRFEREVQAMATLTHWNTVEIYDYGIAEDGTFYYVMEYLPGLSLQELVERHGPLSPARAIYILRQICAGLKEAHNIGLIHRDIKPSNVILCQRGGAFDVAKLLDFGLVQGFGFENASDRLTLQGTILGSPPYMSPEQALGKGQIDARTDIYSLGGLAYFLLTGQPPFQRETAMELLMAHVHDAVPPLRDIRPEAPPDLEEIVLNCLAKKPDGRFPNIHRLDRALADCAAAEDWDGDRAREWWDESRGEKKTPVLAGYSVTPSP
jgi:serine/threonine protein kinase